MTFKCLAFIHAMPPSLKFASFCTGASFGSMKFLAASIICFIQQLSIWGKINHLAHHIALNVASKSCTGDFFLEIESTTCQFMLTQAESHAHPMDSRQNRHRSHRAGPVPLLPSETCTCTSRVWFLWPSIIHTDLQRQACDCQRHWYPAHFGSN